MKQLIATVFNYSLDGFLADEGTDFWTFCFDQPENRVPDAPSQLEFLSGADAHIMGRTAYEGISVSMMTNTDHPFSPILNAAPKLVFSRTLQAADWPNTTIASGDTKQEVENLRQGGNGYIIAWGGVTLWQSLMQHDLLDEIRVSMYSYVAGEGTRLFDGAPSSYALELVSSTPSGTGFVSLRYRRPR